ncbi:uncharacterized protein LOC111717453, partial [Eurytemora carolleeae]|uniref:uncharacterized protein LOC111717453 n=1 Tax=Eurytemora carolleeae TaxID=1294199 RepID=UPI000C785432
MPPKPLLRAKSSDTLRTTPPKEVRSIFGIISDLKDKEREETRDPSQPPSMADLIRKVVKKEKKNNEPPPPTADEIARAYCRKILTLSQKGEWEVASETLKNLEMMITKQEVDRKLVSGSVDPLTGNTPIMFAAIENKISFMERLVAVGFNINKRNKENYTALHF